MAVKFVIIGSQRTGSTLLRMKLNSLLSIRCHGEVFLGKYNAADGFKNFLYNSKFFRFYFTILTNKLGKYLVPKFVLSNILFDFLDYLFNDVRCSDAFQDFADSHKFLTNVNFNSQEAVGFKLMYDQLKNFPSIENYLKKNEVKIIHLVRRNKLDQYVSKLKMRKTKVAHSIDLKSKDVIKVDVLLNSFDKFLKKEQKDENSIDKIFSELDVKKVYYEDIFAEFDSILSFLNITDKLTLDKDLKLKKIESKSLKDVVSNYKQVVEFCINNNIKY